MNNTHQRLVALTEHILQKMQQQDGAISFHDWMQAALYQPDLGYYQREEVFGAQGDFTTATAMGKWLALGLADTIKKSWEALGSPQQWTLIEQGGGTGVLLCHVLEALRDSGLLVPSIYAVETSQTLQERQQQSYAKHQLDINQVSSLAEIPHQQTVVYFSNELPDAFPVRCFIWRQGNMIERGVDWNGQAFIWQQLAPIPAQDHHISPPIQALWPEDYISEFNPNLFPWQHDIASLFDNGIVITVDYGYTQQEYYRPQRIEGTLMGHHQHQTVDDVLKLSPGVCDITAHIDFSALHRIGEQVGLQTLAYTTQGAWLAQCESVQTKIQLLAANPSPENMAEMTHAKRLLLPVGMGESFKIMIQGQGIDAAEQLRTPAFDRTDTL